MEPKHAEAPRCREASHGPRKGVARGMTLRGTTLTVKYKLTVVKSEQPESGHYPRSGQVSSAGFDRILGVAEPGGLSGLRSGN